MKGLRRALVAVISAGAILLQTMPVTAMVPVETTEGNWESQVAESYICLLYTSKIKAFMVVHDFPVFLLYRIGHHPIPVSYTHLHASVTSAKRSSAKSSFFRNS